MKNKMTKERFEEIKNTCTSAELENEHYANSLKVKLRECVAEIERLEAACREKETYIQNGHTQIGELLTKQEELEATVEQLKQQKELK